MSAYRCPLCQKPLQRQDNSLTCNNNHQFDYAKEGYVNLLPVQYKKSKQPGDNQEMVQARRRFLAEGCYEFLRNALAQKVSELHQSGSHIVDMGCGEGYYTSEIANKLSHKGAVFGIDIAKPAIRYAAKRYNQCEFAVASSKQIPLTPHCASVVTSVFAPVFAQESARLLVDNGYLVVVSPGPEHLRELKQLIYKEVRQHDEVSTPNGFERRSQQLLTETLNVRGTVAKDLSLMTPFAWKFSEPQLSELAQRDEVQISVQFYLSVFQKSS